MIELSKRIIELIENARKYVVKNTNTTQTIYPAGKCWGYKYQIEMREKICYK
jgi:hypothetical protein